MPSLTKEELIRVVRRTSHLAESAEEKCRERQRIEEDTAAFLQSGKQVQVVGKAGEVLRGVVSWKAGRNDYERGRAILAKKRRKKQSGRVLGAEDGGVSEARKDGGLDSRDEERIQQIPVRPEGEGE